MTTTTTEKKKVKAQNVTTPVGSDYSLVVTSKIVHIRPNNVLNKFQKFSLLSTLLNNVYSTGTILHLLGEVADLDVTCITPSITEFTNCVMSSAISNKVTTENNSVVSHYSLTTTQIDNKRVLFTLATIIQ